MTNQVPSSPGTNENRLPIVSENHQNAALGMPMAAAPWMDSEEKKDGFDIAAFLHSLRRRWIVGLGVGFLVASIVAGVLWLFVPIQTEAMVLIRVRRADDSGVRVRPGTKKTTSDFNLFKQTQADLIKSTYVINAALRKAGISQKEIVKYSNWGRKRDEPVAWLQGKVRVDSPEGTEIVVMRMKERNREEVIDVLNAITDAYMDEIITRDRVLQTGNLERLRDRERRVREEIKKKMNSMKLIADTAGSMQSDQNKIQIDLIFNQLRTLQSDRQMVQRELRATENELFIMQEQLRTSQSYQPRDWEIEDALTQVNPEYQTLRIELNDLKTRSSLGAGSPYGNTAFQSQQQSIMQKLNTIKQQQKKEIVDRLKLSSGRDSTELQNRVRTLSSTRNMYMQRLQGLQKAYVDQANLVKTKGQSNADLEILSMEIESSAKLSHDLKEEIEGLEGDISAKQQIQVLQDAHVPAESSWLTKYMQIAGSWILALIGTLLGIAFWDFQSKRVNSTKDVSENVDMRVLGTLPLLNGRRAGGLLPMSGNMRKSIEIGLGRSIDSIRTSLLFGKMANSVDVVMVTSALGQEGKTTVASQLAVSLARSGRRTLLIDGDVRNPQQHVVLGIPFNAGLCELIRSDVNLEDVVHASPAENLWYLSAGYRDSQTDQYLASPLLGNILEDLKSRFDIIVVDTGPALTSPDAMLIGQHADIAILSVRRDISRLPKVKEAADRLRTVGVRIAGTVVNGISMDTRHSEIESPVASSDPQIANASPAAAPVSETVAPIADPVDATDDVFNDDNES